MVKKGSKACSNDLPLHSSSCVAHLHAEVLAGLDVRVQQGELLAELGVLNLDDQATPVGHRMAGVHRQIDEHLFDLTRISLDVPEARGELRFVNSTRSPSAWRRSFSNSRYDFPTSSISGLTSSRRLKMSSWRVSAAARSAARRISSTS